MKLHAAFLSDAAVANADGTFMVWRGGITDVMAAQFPALVKFAMVVRLELDEAEVGQLHELSMSIFHAGQQLGGAQAVPLAIREVPGETRYYLNFVMDLAFPVPKPGNGHIQGILDGDLHLPQLHFRIHEVQQAGPSLTQPPPSAG
jgi:hypothetical protein